MSLTRNITREFRAASAEHIAAGCAWYADARAVADAMHDETGIDVERAAGILAALSPMLSWDRNVVVAWALIRTGDTSGVLRSNVVKAQAILAGGDPREILKGEKVRAFFMNILTSGQDSGVTVDRHAIDVALGIKHSDATRPNLSKSRYAEIADAYRRAARILSKERGERITPAQIQAVTWCSWRARNAWRRVAA